MAIVDIDDEQIRYFRDQLLEWALANPRQLPWKGIKDPYVIWLSEIILQQTRVEQGTPWFNKFVQRYPTVHDLAIAPEDEVMKMWEGLGYYSRARNLHATAKTISDEHRGIFPNTVEGLMKLRGVGNYTAAAIASFAFDLPHAVVDGNVYRVISRVFGLRMPIDSTEGKKKFAAVAEELLDTQNPARWNQAMMDFGAVHCLPAKPLCECCPLAGRCVALTTGAVAQLPAKGRKLKRLERFFNYLVVIDSGRRVLISKRKAKDIWRNLYEFPLVETGEVVEALDDLVNGVGTGLPLVMDARLSLVSKSVMRTQVLTHQTIKTTFWELACEDADLEFFSNFLTADRKMLAKFAFPKSVDLYLKQSGMR